MTEVTGIDHIYITVSDLARSEPFSIRTWYDQNQRCDDGSDCSARKLTATRTAMAMLAAGFRRGADEALALCDGLALAGADLELGDHTERTNISQNPPANAKKRPPKPGSSYADQAEGGKVTGSSGPGTDSVPGK